MRYEYNLLSNFEPFEALEKCLSVIKTRWGGSDYFVEIVPSSLDESVNATLENLLGRHPWREEAFAKDSYWVFRDARVIDLIRSDLIFDACMASGSLIVTCFIDKKGISQAYYNGYMQTDYPFELVKMHISRSLKQSVFLSGKKPIDEKGMNIDQLYMIYTELGEIIVRPGTWIELFFTNSLPIAPLQNKLPSDFKEFLDSIRVAL